MNKRQFLSSAVASLLSVLVLSFIWVLFSGVDLTGEPRESDSVNNQHKLFKGLVAGRVALRHYQRQSVWVLKLSSQQQAQATSLAAYVVNQAMETCHESDSFCVLSAATKRTGIKMHYTQQTPAQLGLGIPWHGGYVDPTNGVLYDFLGRVYKDQEKKLGMISIKIEHF